MGNRGQQENVDLFTVINFAEQNITTLSKYSKKLKTQLECNLTQQATYLTEPIKFKRRCIKATCI